MGTMSSVWLSAALAISLILGIVDDASAQEVYIDWVSVPSVTSATFNFGALTGTVTVGNEMNWSGSLASIEISDGLVNYPDSWYTPSPPLVGLEWLQAFATNAVLGSVGSMDMTVVFSGSVTDPKFHFINLDNATIDFGTTTDTGGGAVSVTRLSGNSEFEVTGAIANSTPSLADQNGCESLAGANPNGGCGSVRLNGTYSTVVLSVTDTAVTASGDGFRWTVSAVGPVPVELESFAIE